MLIASLTPDEPERLALLHAIHLLDTPAEPAFDAIVRLTTAMLRVPIALVSLVDRERQWFKAKVGLSDSQTARDISFCSHAILGDGPFVVPDAHLDPRFHDNPLVTGAPHLRAYAGVPLRSIDGRRLGTLCAIDRWPRAFTALDLQTLTDFAELAGREILRREVAARALAAAERDRVMRSRGVCLYRAMYEHARQPMAVVDIVGRFDSANAAMLALLDCTEAQLHHLSLPELLHPADGDAVRQALRRVGSADGGAVDLVVHLLTSDGGLVLRGLSLRGVNLGLASQTLVATLLPVGD